MTILFESSRLLLRHPETGDLPNLERIFCTADMLRYLGAPWTPEYIAEVCADWGVEQRWSGVLVKSLHK